MKIVIFDYEDRYNIKKYDYVYLNNKNSFLENVINKSFDVLIINIDFMDVFLENKNLFNTEYTIFISSFIDEDIYSKCLKVADYCYDYSEIYKVSLRLNYLFKKIYSSDVFKYDDLIYYFNKKTLYKNNKPLSITNAEKDLIEILIKNRNRFISKEDILSFSDYILKESSIKVIISSLRKLGFNIINKKNLGYKLKEI